MLDTNFSRPKPGTPLPHSGHRATLWTGLAALAATAALGIAAPRFAGHANAHAASSATQAAMPLARSAPPTSAATWDHSVPAASDVFVNPETGAVITPAAPTF
jgi:hypothetical protein